MQEHRPVIEFQAIQYVPALPLDLLYLKSSSDLIILIVRILCLRADLKVPLLIKDKQYNPADILREQDTDDVQLVFDISRNPAEIAVEIILLFVGAGRAQHDFTRSVLFHIHTYP